MISILSMVKTGQYRDFIRIRFEFEFDDASLLPIGTYTWGVKTYFIEEGSKARDTINNIYYEYIKGKWSKIITPPIPTFKTPKNTTYNDNGEYSVSNNDLVGFNDIKVDVSSTPPTLIEKSITENNTYNASDDGADGYSSVNVDVANSYTTQDEGKVVSNQELIAQTAYPTEITENDTYDTTNYNSITVNVSSGGASSSTDVIFYDYDGTIVASYSTADFANLSAMPDNPTHEGLTAQGWNWSLADAKSYVVAYGKLNIGQMYITNDGKTRLYFTVTKDGLSVELYLDLESDTELDVDWGDNSAHTTWTSADGDSSKSHEYASAGRYVIAIEVITGEFYLSSPLSNVYKIEIGNGVVSIGNQAFSSCNALSSITIPSSVTSIGESAFGYCTASSSITIPSSVTSIEQYTFNNCSTLSSITIPDGVTNIGDGTFCYCSTLSSITIPDGVTSIGNQAFSSCNALSSITIPSSVTSIDDYVFSGCNASSSITIPSSVTSIGDAVFDECYAISSIKFESSTPPNLEGDLRIPNICIIRVPQGSLSAYTSAENYPDPEYYIYEEY